MPFILKPPSGRSKGIVVFTHKEAPFLLNPRRVLADAIARVRGRYVIGMHWGHFRDDVGDIPGVDFHLAGPGTVRFRQGVKARHIPLCSRNFTRDCFRDLGLPKYWDIISVARPIRLKNLDQLLRVVRTMYDHGHQPRVLLVCAHPSNMTECDGWYTTLSNDYERLFSPTERERVTLLMLNADENAFPLPSPVLSYLYNSSRALALFSDQEGESRVIAEALLCGLVVVVKRSLRGGGRDYLDDDNSIQFDTLDEASAGLEGLMTGRRQCKFDVRRLEEELGERCSAPNLAESMQRLFDELGLEFQGDLDLVDLGRKLPSHYLSLPISLRRDSTNDLRSEEAAIHYMNLLCGRTLSGVERWRMIADKCRGPYAAVVRQADRAGRRARSVVRTLLDGWV